ncbi:BREX-2 system phosphatase PglZ [Streptosporangium sp. NPDC006930]|uniref:BREX-2 system phosphatase PglZ n=1 Tax=unclassified Streptosporangium TaxID=2632669 RepID=UPI00341304AC
MSPASVASRPLPITIAALEQEVARLLRRYAKSDQRVLLIRAAPDWAGADEITLNGRTVRIAACVSPLAVMEQVTAHLDRDGGEGDGDDGSVLVVLTDAEESTLGVGLLSRVIRQRIFVVEPWRLVEESFGAQRTDPRLVAEGWAAEALIDAMPPGGWPRLTGAMLTREIALGQLAARRLRLDRLGIGADELSAAALLLWSSDPAAVEAFCGLRETEREGLRSWLRETTGSTVDVLFQLVDGGHAADALALGLVCGALWNPSAEGVAQRAQGGALAYISAVSADTSARGGPHPSVEDASIRAFAATAERFVAWLLRDGGDAGEARLAHATLERAEDLVVQFGARAAARHSDLLGSGFEDRLDDVASALSAALEKRSAPSLAVLADTVAGLRTHVLARAESHRVRRAEMAQRLLQWLVRPHVTAERVSGVGPAVQAQIDEWGWVDRARDDLWLGEPHHRPLKEAYRRLHDLVRTRGHELNRAFAAKLSAWTATGPGDLLTVDTVLPRVVAPLVADRSDRGRPLLFVVLDGMSAAVATELAEELRERNWEEYDPVPDSGGRARRRAVVAAIPTMTRVSRASLFAARLVTGDAAEERKAFENHPFWKGRKVRLFHKGSLSGSAGESLGEELTTALEDVSTHVGVVLNTIDDTLDKGRGRIDDAWGVADVGILRTLLHHARLQGRAVILTSDHGHVLERGGTLRTVPDPRSARHRDAGAPVGEGEVELAGPRVAGGRLVALWDPYLRYLPGKAGYHGGASLAEVTVPLLAFLPLGSSVPDGWRALPDQRPEWWSLEAAPSPPSPPPPPSPSPVPQAPAGPRTKGRKAPQVAQGPTLFDDFQDFEEVAGSAAVDEPAASNPNETLVTELLATELFAAQHQMTPRRVQKAKIHAVLLALLDTGGPLPLPVVAQSAGEHTVRAAGFVATLQRILNVDNYPVLSITDNGRSARLDAHLLREQFGLGNPRK